MKQPFNWFKGLDVTKKVLLGVGALIILAVATNNNRTTSLSVNNTSNKTAASKPAPKAPVITTKIATETEAVPFTNTTVQDGGLAQGTTKVTTTGVNGVQTKTYKVTYSDGKQTKKELTNTTVTTPPITQVTSVGTYVAPPPPTYTAPVVSAGSGATAQCSDGSYSYAAHHQGACSHHGGVATWYN